MLKLWLHDNTYLRRPVLNISITLLSRYSTVMPTIRGPFARCYLYSYQLTDLIPARILVGKHLFVELKVSTYKWSLERDT